ncbi:MAG: hypothetical protein M1276_05990, partial [Deltaproteobacteria bacterium]|nr:hypothetical protein [Deltaproteobacteria bacterium]
MLDVKIKLHRHYLLADAPNQKLFVLLEISSDKKCIDSERQEFSAVFAVDTSGSMREPAVKPEDITVANTAVILNNASMTRVLDKAVKELQDGKTINEGTLKALKV